jgi:H/ACA ribonucleoprotein complex subunit 4
MLTLGQKKKVKTTEDGAEREETGEERAKRKAEKKAKKEAKAAA